MENVFLQYTLHTAHSYGVSMFNHDLASYLHVNELSEACEMFLFLY